MLGYCVSNIFLSPYTWYIVHGAMVLTSPQPAEVPLLFFNTSGITKGTCPSGYWSAARSFSHLVKKADTSMLNAAVRQNACASPVHPSRSSRCGQSVGTSRKFPLCPHSILCCSWFTKESEQAKVPLTGISE